MVTNYRVNAQQQVTVADWIAIRRLTADKGDFEALAGLVERWIVPAPSREVLGHMPLSQLAKLPTKGVQ
jgi:hypothetical protein